MSKHFHRLTVKEIKKETSDCVVITFDIPAALKDSFTFTQGQSLTVKTGINNSEVRRTYSICSSPFDNELRVAVKKVESGLFSGYANEQLKKGDVLDVMQPVGKFYTELSPSNKKNYLAFAAGSGITPILSIIKTTLLTEPQSSFTLVFGNKNKNSIIFKDELEALKDKFINRFRMVHILSRERTEAPINSGRINKEKLTALSKLVNYAATDEFFVCGPEEMIFTVKDFLEEQGVDKKKIHFELFTTPGQKIKSEVGSKKPESDGPKSKITIKLDGRSIDFDLAFNSTIVF